MTESSARLDPPSAPFFRRVDWSSFWTATLISFAVYFLTAAPSVTLEDAGELAVAGDYLGVPHPPGYPIWTICAWIFARLFSFVTFRGQPNPAWAIAVLSGLFGAIATGMTAMLITRTSADMLRDMEGDDTSGGDLSNGDANAPALREGRAATSRDVQAVERGRNALCWTGGVAGSLIFAFSPVMWSQSTIVEVYTLNAVFLMWIFLLSYRWMRRPSDRTLWLTAFVFGLGMTNYQVLLLAAVPLMIVVFLKDVALFRDFLLAAIPFVVTLGILKLGAEPSKPGFAKHRPYEGYEALLGPPLVSPIWYVLIVAALLAVVIGCVLLGLRERQGKSRASSDDATIPVTLLVSGGALLVLALLFVPAAAAIPPAPGQPVFQWAVPVLGFLGTLAALWAFAVCAPGGVWYATAITCIEVALGGLLTKGALLGLTHPATGWFWAYVTLNFVVLALVWVLLPHGRNVALTFLSAEAGVAFYGYMPVSSDRNPPMNWGYARTWEGFKHAITRGQYEKISPTNAFSPLFIQQLGSYFTDLRTQFTLLLAPLGFLPFAVWQFRAGNRRVRAFGVAFGIAVLVAVIAVLGKGWVPSSGGMPRVDKALVAVVILMASVGVLTLVINQVAVMIDTVRGEHRALTDRITAGLCLLGGAVVVAVLTVGFANATAEFLLELAKIAAPASNATPAAHRAYALQAYTLTFVLVGVVGCAVAGLAVAARRRLADYHMRLDDTAQQWLIATMAGFLMMSLFLIVLANPKGDLQDSFIQKVKFVSSHGLFAVWIGYGIAFGLATVASVLRRWGMGWAVVPAMALALATPLIPVYENYFNESLVDIMSAANQDGHDFGWQFGNYQLRGAEAITEELAPDEEPLPNPDYPPPMTTNAVFYGGTDPGRFVPTYMIYSANVRPDVLLITQNALADNTYMNTMRDLYGDIIWMPSPKDNGAAFQQYVKEVEEGKRPNYGDISFEGGRVQVTGALAVMEINGILTEQIFRQNRERHDFYVEESYTIRWMFPYLIPHGLIMKINRDETPLHREIVAADMDFWDWYARRLMVNWRFQRDVVARKSFSKLRGAIAGLYAARGMQTMAERAFREARTLYVVSPEANLRLAQEVLLPYRRFDEAYELLDGLHRADPNNTRMPGILDHIRGVREMDRRMNELVTKRKEPTGLTPDETLELARCYVSMGRPDVAPTFLDPIVAQGGLTSPQLFEVARLYQGAKRISEASAVLLRIPDAELDRPEFPSEVLLSMASIHAGANNFDAAVKVLVRHLKREPSDHKAWLDLATMNLRLRRPDQAAAALQQALRIGGQEALELVQRSPELQAFANNMLERVPMGPRLPAPR